MSNAARPPVLQSALKRTFSMHGDQTVPSAPINVPVGLQTAPAPLFTSYVPTGADPFLSNDKYLKVVDKMKWWANNVAIQHKNELSVILSKYALYEEERKVEKKLSEMLTISKDSPEHFRHMVCKLRAAEGQSWPAFAATYAGYDMLVKMIERPDIFDQTRFLIKVIQSMQPHHWEACGVTPEW